MKRIISTILFIALHSVAAADTPDNFDCAVPQKYLSRSVIKKSEGGDMRILTSDPKSGVSIIRNGKTAPISVQYSLKQNGEMGGRRVSVYEVMFSGFDENLDGGEKKRWAGIGMEIRDSACQTPLIRRYQIRRGSSLVDNFDDEIFYSEAAIGE